jgi:hypothetical protein
LLQHAATFTDSQFGHRIEGSSHYSRYGAQTNAWNAEIEIYGKSMTSLAIMIRETEYRIAKNHSQYWNLGSLRLV